VLDDAEPKKRGRGAGGNPLGRVLPGMLVGKGGGWGGIGCGGRRLHRVPLWWVRERRPGRHRGRRLHGRGRRFSSHARLVLGGGGFAIGDVLVHVVSDRCAEFPGLAQVFLEALGCLHVAHVLLVATALVVEKSRILGLNEELGQNGDPFDIVAGETRRLCLPLPGLLFCRVVRLRRPGLLTSSEGDNKNRKCETYLHGGPSTSMRSYTTFGGGERPLRPGYTRGSETTVRQWRLSPIRVTLSFVDLTPKQTAEILRQRSAEARAQAEARARATREQVIQAVKARLPPGARAWLIGSLAWGDFGERSDVDLVMAGVDSTLATSIEVAVCRAAQAEVDLLTFEWLSPSFRERVEREGLAIHGQ